MRRLVLFFLAVTAWGQPRLFLGSSDLARLNQLAEEKAWAAAARDSILRAADNFPNAHLQKYGLSELALPPEGGQWWHWYVCKSGVRLQYRPPNTNFCPSDNTAYSGWPFDQVVYSMRHDDLAIAARDLALAYRISGKRSYAEHAAWILTQYAAQYPGYAIHDKDRRQGTSGARAHAQTLDESIWIIPLAWAYDLLSDSDVLTAAQRSDIEQNLLRATAATIRRYDAGVSNWQSWHNAGIGAVGFSLGDQELINAVLDGKSGFRFQAKNSIEDEGFWYEGAWGYHFYALDALVQLAQMAAANGVDLWADPALQGMFTVPLRLAFADGTLPAFNDSNSIKLSSQARLYDQAFARYQEPSLGAVAASQGRTWLGWLLGASELPSPSLDDLPSSVFEKSGFAMLRAPGSDHAVAFKFGPHGGGHGHNDKLNFTSFANGGILAVDPGTQSYGAPTHDTWDKMTVAHNTVVVGERTQAAATGKLRWHSFGEGYAAASAESGPVYPNASLARTLLVTKEYTLDVFQAESTNGQAQAFDWVYHNNGQMKNPMATSPYTAFPRNNGYQHLTSNRAAQPSNDWQVTFDGTPTGQLNYGSVYKSTTTVDGTWRYSNEQAASGKWSGKLSYGFTGPGYLLLSTPILTGQPDKAPIGIMAKIWGDGSGHVLALRFNDATDERFVATVGPINWTGWREIRVSNPIAWTHYLGNNNGIIETPVRTVSVEFNRTANGAQTGAIYIDDLTLNYPEEEQVIAGFEIANRHLRVWMLGEEGTTVVTGNGLGPDLTVPVPFVMARRNSIGTRFVSLLEPFSDQPGIREFRALEDGGWLIAGEGFTDRVQLTSEGVVYRRE
ncbi:MAG: heparinase II/III family protein [Bryobacterales bacterium]|nr:heparinase II/III family protein [Bryobacterales bacterium]